MGAELNAAPRSLLRIYRAVYFQAQCVVVNEIRAARGRDMYFSVEIHASRAADAFLPVPPAATESSFYFGVLLGAILKWTFVTMSRAKNFTFSTEYVGKIVREPRPSRIRVESNGVNSSRRDHREI